MWSALLVVTDSTGKLVLEFRTCDSQSSFRLVSMLSFWEIYLGALRDREWF